MDSDTPDDGGVSAARSFLNSVSANPARPGDTSNLHPSFAVNLAGAIQDARSQGLNAFLQSGYRAPGQLISQGDHSLAAYYDASGASMHSYGAAADIGGIGSAGSPQAQQWAQIANQHGLSNPYGVNNPREFNHWQLVPWTLESRPDVQAQLKSAGGDQGKIWSAIAPTPTAAPQSPNASAVGESIWNSLKSNGPGAAAPAGSAPIASPAVQSGEALWQAINAAPAAQAAPAPAAVAPQGAPGSYPLGDPRNQGIVPNSYTKGVNSAPNDTVDPYTPATQQLATAARNTAGYIGGQVAGIPGAIETDFRNSTALNAQGNAEGDTPRGLLKSVAGVAGQVTAPLSGTIRQLVQDPVTQGTGNPQAGEVAGIAANVAAGNAVGGAGSATARGIGNATLGTLDPETAQLASIARDQYGIPVNVGQMSPSPGVRFASSALNRLPLSGAASDIAEQQTAFNRAVTNTIGEDAPKITPDVMNAARTRIGNTFDAVAQNTTIKADPQFQSDLQTAMLGAHRELADTELRPLNSIFDNVVDKINPNGTIDGSTYQALTRANTPLSRAVNNSNPNISYWGGQIKDALDDALQRSAPPDAQDALSQAKLQWRNLKTIEPLVAKAPTGDISPALLSQAVNGNPFTRNALAYNSGGDLGTLARIGQKFLKEPPSSGTAERASTLGAMYKLGQLGLGATGLGELGYQVGMSPGAMAWTAASVPASLGVGSAVGGILRSKTLANALINRSLNTGGQASRLPLMALAGAGGATNAFLRGNGQ